MLYRNLTIKLVLVLLLAACGKGDPQAPASAASGETAMTPNSSEIVADTTLQEAVTEQSMDSNSDPDAIPPEAIRPLATIDNTVAPGVPTDPASPVDMDKPYQLVDGKISDNVMEGWKTYNGGGCGTCHGKGGIGAVGPNLAESLKTKIGKADFMEIVINGRPGTMMRPNTTNQRVMDNLDNLYAYLLARSDGVLGPENLIKFPLGKTE